MIPFEPIVFLQQLIRFNTTNPPGDEKACIYYIKEVLAANGLSSTIYSKDSNRPNLISVIKGSGEKKPLLFYGHVDVVPANEKDWSQPPFEGKIEDGLLYGRGTLDMKGGVTMLVATFIKMSKQALNHDLVLAIVSDEEVAGEYGAQYLVENHPVIFDGIQHAIGEFGGFTINLNGKKTYLIQVAEKQVCWLQLKIQGTGGHASIPFKNGVLYDLANILLKLNKHEFPLKESPLARRIFNKLASIVDYQNGSGNNWSNPEDLQPFLTILGANSPLFSCMLSNTVNVTKVNCGIKTNVIPREVIIEMDGRLLPGQKPENLIEELSTYLGIKKEQFSVIKYAENPQESVDWALYKQLKATLQEMEDDAPVSPILIGGSTDARHFAKLGIQTYGFLPMNLPLDFPVFNKIHGVDEYIPIYCLDFGIRALEIFLQKYQAAIPVLE